MVLFADNKYRYSLQWDAFSEEQIRAGQLMERLGNHKSKVVVPALIEYMERHPEVMLPDGKINIVVQQAQSREQMETMVKSMACLLYTSPSPRDMRRSRMPSSA